MYVQIARLNHVEIRLECNILWFIWPVFRLIFDTWIWLTSLSSHIFTDRNGVYFEWYDSLTGVYSLKIMLRIVIVRQSKTVCIYLFIYCVLSNNSGKTFISFIIIILLVQNQKQNICKNTGFHVVFPFFSVHFVCKVVKISFLRV